MDNQKGAVPSDLIREELRLLNHTFLFSNNNLQTYKSYLVIQNYFMSVYNNTTESEEFEEIELDFFRYLWTYGELFVTFIDNRLQLWQVGKKVYNGVHLEKLEARLIWNGLQLYHNNYLNYVEFTNNVDGIYVPYYSNSVVYNSIFIWWDWLDKQTDLFNVFYSNCLFDVKKFVYQKFSSSEKVAQMEIDSFKDISNPFILNLGSLALGNENISAQNEIIPLEKGESQSKVAFENLQNYENYIYNKLGLMSQIDLKKERKTTSEATMDIYNTLNVESITLRNLNRFAKQAKKLWGLDLLFEQTTDINKADSENTDENKGLESNND